MTKSSTTSRCSGRRRWRVKSTASPSTRTRCPTQSRPSTKRASGRSTTTPDCPSSISARRSRRRRLAANAMAS
eukprot:6303475-Lingulodinium_polyedra.AAC.1